MFRFWLPLMDLLEAIHWPMAFYLFCAASVIVLEPLAASRSAWLPPVVQNTVRIFLGFGKTLDVKKNKGSLLVKFCTVPKRWFTHFYIVSATTGVCSVALLVLVYGLAIPPPAFILRTLDLITTPNRAAAGSSLQSIVSTALLALQCCARLYECCRVSVFSATAVMNILQYFVGFAHYIFAYAVILSQTPALTTGGSSQVVVTSSDWWRCIAACAVFLVAFFVQRDSLRRLAALKRPVSADGSRGYAMPTGGCFSAVSCPHMSAEITMYAALSLLQPNVAWASLMLFIISNQVHVALSNHRWYSATFKDYPIGRTAIVPGLL